VMHPRSSSLLRRALIADAVASGASGLLMTLGAGLLERLLAVPATLLQYAGLGLLPYTALLAWLATRENPPRAAVWAVIACNGLWAANCLMLAFAGWVEPTGLGYGFILAQAVAVVLFAELQYGGLRRSTAAVA